MLRIRLLVIRFVLIGPAILGYVEAWGSDWILIKTTDEGNVFYDAENITRRSKNRFLLSKSFQMAKIESLNAKQKLGFFNIK